VYPTRKKLILYKVLCGKKKMKHSWRQWFDSLGWFLLSLLIFTYGLRSSEVVSFDSRFYLFASEMWRHGFTWFPMTYGEPYPDYPVSSTALIYVCSRLFGGLSKLTAVLPSAIAASFVVVYTRKIGALYDKRLAAAAATMLFLTLTFVKSARSISLDMYPLLAATLVYYHLVRADLLKQPRSYFVLSGWLIFGFVMRGPIGLVIPAGVMSVFHLTRHEVRGFIKDGLLALCWLILGTAGLLALAYHVGGLPFVTDVSRMEVAGRIDNYFLPYSFYFTDSLGSYALTYPMAVLVFIGLCFAYYRERLSAWPYVQTVWQWSAWVLVILVGLSLPGDKKVRYILSISPAIALLAAYPMILDANAPYLRRLRAVFNFVFRWLPGLFLLALFKVMSAFPAAQLNMSIPFIPLCVFLVILQGVNVWHSLKIKNRAERSLRSIFIAAIAFIMLNLFLVEPIEINVDKAKVFVNDIETARANRQAALVFYRERPDGLPIKYLVNSDRDDDPVFVESISDLMAVKNPAVIVCSTEYYQALTAAQKARFKVLMTGKIGHVPVTVFTPAKKA
jgi:4-amino-4-deoxy-L-arabinose transferase-like glycosyltransferase